MPDGGQSRREIPAADRAWGLMPIARYGEILERAVERDHVPRFGEHGIDAAAAWARLLALEGYSQRASAKAPVI
jgi:hypothetical protein